MTTREKFRHPVIISLLFAIIIVLLCFTINRFQFFYSTNDDYYISQFLAEGEDKSIFLNYFFLTRRNAVIMLFRRIVVMRNPMNRLGLHRRTT